MRHKLHSFPAPGGNHGIAAAPLLLLGAVIGAIVLFVVLSNRQAADGPVPVIWDKTPCAWCAMHLGEPRFAAQLATADGTTYFYDDPGCLMLHQSSLGAATTIHARWFHDVEKEGWIEAAEVSFLRIENTPMDYGFGAVQRGNLLAVSLEEATAEVLAQ